MDFKRLMNSFSYAWRGVLHAIQYEKNLRIHLIVTGFVFIGIGIWQIKGLELTVLLITMAGVLVTELINTAIERIVDMVEPRYHQEAGHIKDIAAGAVLVSAFFALLIGITIFGPHLLEYFK